MAELVRGEAAELARVEKEEPYKLVDIIHVTTLSFFFYSLLGLLLGTDEKDVATINYYLADKVTGFV